jgi:hypothetical protein
MSRSDRRPEPRFLLNSAWGRNLMDDDIEDGIKRIPIEDLLSEKGADELFNSCRPEETLSPEDRAKVLDLPKKRPIQSVAA